MNKRTKLILALATILIFSFSISGNAIVYAATIEGFTYSDKLVAGVELAWTLKEFEATSEEGLEDAYIPLTATKNMSKGDVFKIVLSQNLNDLSLLSMGELYYTTQPWGEFFLNGVSLGTNAAALIWTTFYGTSGFLMSSHIIPVTVELATGNMSYFDYLEDDFLGLSEEESEGITIKNTADAFIMKYNFRASITFLITMSVKMNLEIVYNKEWGVLSKYDLTESVKFGGESAKIRMLYEINNEEIKVAPFSWIVGFISIFVTGAVILRRRKK
jgi:hypothetical protein